LLLIPWVSVVKRPLPFEIYSGQLVALGPLPGEITSCSPEKTPAAIRLPDPDPHHR
jgi:hypothetical protein